MRFLSRLSTSRNLTRSASASASNTARSAAAASLTRRSISSSPSSCGKPHPANLSSRFSEHRHSSPSPSARATTEGTRRHFPQSAASQQIQASRAAATPSTAASNGVDEWFAHAAASIQPGGGTPGGSRFFEGVFPVVGFGSGKQSRFAPSSAPSASSEADSSSDALNGGSAIVASFPSGGARASAACIPSSWRATAAASVLLSVRSGAAASLANDRAAVGGSAPSAPGAGPARAAACASDAAVANGETGDVGAAAHGGGATAAGTAVGTAAGATGASPAVSAPGAAVARPSSAIEVPFFRAPKGEADDRRSRPSASRPGSNRESDGSGARDDRDPCSTRLRATRFPSSRGRRRRFQPRARLGLNPSSGQDARSQKRVFQCRSTGR